MGSYIGALWKVYTPYRSLIEAQGLGMCSGPRVDISAFGALLQAACIPMLPGTLLLGPYGSGALTIRSLEA